MILNFQYHMIIIMMSHPAGIYEAGAGAEICHGDWPHVRCASGELNLSLEQGMSFFVHTVSCLFQVYRQRTFFLLCRSGFTFFKVQSK